MFAGRYEESMGFFLKSAIYGISASHVPEGLTWAQLALLVVLILWINERFFPRPCPNCKGRTSGRSKKPQKRTTRATPR